jgi:hypothetical protein
LRRPDRWVGSRRYNRENELLEIAAEDGISDNGEEIYSYFCHQKIRNVVLMGAHQHVRARSAVRHPPAGAAGMNVALARDLTDAMYDPRQRPRVSHERGTEMIIEHIERYWCPSVHSEDSAHNLGFALLSGQLCRLHSMDCSFLIGIIRGSLLGPPTISALRSRRCSGGIANAIVSRLLLPLHRRAGVKSARTCSKLFTVADMIGCEMLD